LIFGVIPLAQADGAILAHTTRVRGLVLRKGARLTPQAIARLRAAGVQSVTAARLEDGDVAEDAAALRMADALLGPGILRAPPVTGRANLMAAHAGLFRADASAIDGINAVHEAITVATLPDATPVAAGALLVTVKIIPFSVPAAALAQAEQRARAARPLAVPPFRPLRAGLILTELPGLKASVLAGTEAATRGRVQALGGSLMEPLRVRHSETAVTAALAALLDQGAELLLVAAASASVDRGDVGPASIIRAGGTVDHFGMPVDPGNLICIGRVGHVPALVLPGCARSPALNGIDLVLARLFAGQPAGRAEITRLGVGGLLKEFSARPAPRTRSAPRARKRVAGLILAAGLSSRMAPDNKLLLPDEDGVAMVARVADAVLGSRAAPVLAVLGHQAAQVSAALGSRAVRPILVPDYADGMSASLRAGLRAVPDDAAAVLVCLGDMPLVSSAMIDRLVDAYDADEGRLIIVPTHGGRRGNPVLWDRSFFSEMAALTGDKGARGLFPRFAEHVVEIEMETDAVLRDFDTKE
jgi:molybdenum cofactor cytidylyltransferase